MSHISDSVRFPLTRISQGFHSDNPILDHSKALKKLCQGNSVIIWGRCEQGCGRDTKTQGREVVPDRKECSQPQAHKINSVVNPLGFDSEKRKLISFVRKWIRI